MLTEELYIRPLSVHRFCTSFQLNRLASSQLDCQQIYESINMILHSCHSNH